MQELDEDFDRLERHAQRSRQATLRLVVLAVAAAIVVGLMIALVGPGLGG